MLRFSKGIPFCLKLVFTEENRAVYGLWIGEHEDVRFELEENTIVGRAKYCDGFPLEYAIHSSLKLNATQKFECEKLIHKAIACMLPKLIMKLGTPTLTFTPHFPDYVWEILQEGPVLFEDDIYLNFAPSKE